MDAEGRWAQQKDWDEERRRGFDIEIKGVSSFGDSCFWRGCDQRAVKTYEIGPVANSLSSGIELCADHDSDENAFEVYREIAGN